MLISVCAAGLVAARPVAAANGDELPSELLTISGVKLDGRRHVPAREIWAALKTQRPSILPWRDQPRLRIDFLRADTAAIAMVCREHGYLDARATWRIVPARRGNQALVRFEIVEGRQSKIGEVSWSGVASVPLDPLRRRVLARTGRPFNPAFLVADTVRVARYYQERGFLPRVAGSFERDTLLRVWVRYAVAEGPHYQFGRTYLSTPGDVTVREHLIRRELLMHEGDAFQMTRVERAIEHLYETGLFSQAQISLLPDTARRVVEFDLRVREKKKRWIDAGVGSGTIERFRFTGEWGHRNLTGHGQQGVVSGRLAIDGKRRYQLGHVETSLLEPWLLRTRTRGQLTGYYEERNDFTVPQWDLHQIARGVSFQLRREIGRWTLVSLTQDNAFITQAVDINDTRLTVARRDSLESATPPTYTTHRLLLTFQRDDRDNPLNPTRGTFGNVVGEVAGGPLKGTSSFSKLQGTVAWYSPSADGWVFAARARAGVIDAFGNEKSFTPDEGLDPQVARVPLENRFRIGGVNSVRGYSENSIPATGGLAMLQGNLELRIPLIGPFGLELYGDAGNVWTRPSHLRSAQFMPRVSHESLKSDDVRYVFGLGPRLNLPIGPLRLDFTWSLRPSGGARALVAAPQFAIGPAF